MRGVQGAGSGGTPRARVRGGVQRADPSAGRRGPPVGGEARLTISVRPLGSPRRAAAQPGEGLVVGNAGGPNNPPANPPGLPTPLPRHGGAAGSASSPPKAAVAGGDLAQSFPVALCLLPWAESSLDDPASDPGTPAAPQNPGPAVSMQTLPCSRAREPRPRSVPGAGSSDWGGSAERPQAGVPCSGMVLL